MVPTDGGGDDDPIAKGLHEAVDGARHPAQCLGAMTSSPNARMPSTVCENGRLEGSTGQVKPAHHGVDRERLDISRGSFFLLVALQEAINRFVAEHNRDPRPFVWTADPDRIVEKVRRGYQPWRRWAEAG